MVPAKDFDPDKDAARIETAIKTKGKLQHAALMAEQKQISAPFCSSLSTDKELVFVSQHSGLKGFDYWEHFPVCCPTARAALSRTRQQSQHVVVMKNTFYVSSLMKFDSVTCCCQKPLMRARTTHTDKFNTL